MKLSSRDIKLILLLIIVAIAILPYIFLIQPAMEANQALETEIDTLESRKSQLEQWAANATRYNQVIADAFQQEQILLDRFPSELPQESILLFIHETEGKVPIRLYQVGFGEDVAAQIASEADETAIRDIEVAAGMESTASEVMQDTTQTASLEEGLQSVAVTSQLSFTVGYQEFKEFLDYILTLKDRMVITSLSASYVAESDSVNGSFTLVQYALTGAGRAQVSLTPPSWLQGTTNIFMRAAGNTFADNVAVAEDAADFVVMLNQPNSTSEAKIVGRSDDPVQSTYLISDDNNEQEITVTFTGEYGEYTADYTIGRDSYEGEELIFNKSGSIYLDILSSQRENDRDRVAARLNIVNRTDQTVYLTVKNDDPENPRVNIMDITGSVLVR